MPETFQKEEARRVLARTKTFGSRFLVLLLEFSMIPQLLPLMTEEGLLGPGWQAIGSDSLAWGTSHSFLPLGFMMVLAQGRGFKFPRFLDLWARLEFADFLGEDAQARYKLRKMKTPFAEIPNATLSAQLQAYHAFAFDAVYAFIIAINQLLLEGVEAYNAKGPALLAKVRQTVFSGASGDVRFDANGDRLSEYELLNMQGRSEAPVASPVAIFSLSNLSFSFHSRADLVWMNGKTGLQAPSDLLACGAGFYKEELSRQCKLCPRGMMCSGGVNAPFMACPKGTYASSTGQSNCSLCAEGSSARDVGSVECSPCLPGYEAPREGMEACKRCALGRYMPSHRGTQCLPCGQNQITRESGAESESECLCPEGSFMCLAHGCSSCPEGLYCPEGLGPPLQQGGFWTEPVTGCDFSVLRCRDAFECPQGSLGSCALGREGQACNNCKVNHFPAHDGTCQPCEGADVLPSISVLVVAPSLLLLLTCTNLDPNQQSRFETYFWA